MEDALEAMFAGVSGSSPANSYLLLLSSLEYLLSPNRRLGGEPASSPLRLNSATNLWSLLDLARPVDLIGMSLSSTSLGFESAILRSPISRILRAMSLTPSWQVNLRFADRIPSSETRDQVAAWQPENLHL